MMYQNNSCLRPKTHAKSTSDNNHHPVPSEVPTWYIFTTLYYLDILQSIQFLLIQLPFLVHLNFQPVYLHDSGSYWMDYMMNADD